MTPSPELLLWELAEQHLEAYIAHERLRISALKQHGIRHVDLTIPECGCHHYHYLNHQGQRVISNASQTEWTLAEDVCPDCKIVKQTEHPGYHQNCPSQRKSSA